MGLQNQGEFNNDGGIENIGPIISRFFMRKGLNRALAHQVLHSEWRQAVGPQLAPHTRLAGITGNILRVEVDSAVYLHELSGYMKGSILKQLGSSAGGIPVKDIVFRVTNFR